MKGYYRTLAAAAVMFAAGSVYAEVTQNPADVPSGTYQIETDHTQVAFTVLHFGFTHYDGLFSGAAGTLKLDSADPSKSSLSVSVATDSVYTTSPELTNGLKGTKWLDAAQFPKITFTSTKVTMTGPDSADVAGDITIHGVTKPAVLSAHFVGAGANPMSKRFTAGFDAKTVIKRSDFGVSFLSPMISEDVTLTIYAAFEKKD